MSSKLNGNAIIDFNFENYINLIFRYQLTPLDKSKLKLVVTRNKCTRIKKLRFICLKLHENAIFKLNEFMLTKMYC